MSLIHRKSDTEYVESLKTARRRRGIAAALFLLVGSYALFRLVSHGQDMYNKYREVADAAVAMVSPPQEEYERLADNVAFVIGVQTGYWIALALMIVGLSIAAATQLLVKGRKERLLIQYYDELQAHKEPK